MHPPRTNDAGRVTSGARVYEWLMACKRIGSCDTAATNPSTNQVLCSFHDSCTRTCSPAFMTRTASLVTRVFGVSSRRHLWSNLHPKMQNKKASDAPFVICSSTSPCISCSTDVQASMSIVLTLSRAA